ncbi:MAG: sigma-54 dependent transcriptional regulator [Candidatus Ancaeobacter aquaticus]|nr:sigma-54 dependent transcriptional regulator [Candidatus Ancaeobacter aquaticus]
MSGSKILVVDNDKSMVEVISATLETEAYEICTAYSGHDAIDKVKKERPELVVTDLKMTDMSGIEVLKEVKKIDPEIVVVIVTAFASVQTALDAMKEGAHDYVVKPFKLDELRLVVKRGFDVKKIKEENIYLKKELRERYSFKNIVGKSPEIMDLFDMIKKVSDLDTTVLVEGESGTGKELVAREIHYNSVRSDKPFVAINCGAIPEGILESELFGHVKGAYTGAVSTKHGLFQEASEGTLFLDEIGGMSQAIQVSLLRVLQDKEIRPVGDSKSVKVNVRIIAATNEDLSEKVKAGTFREDLFYRLSVIPINIPPLRERRDDIELLVKHIMDKINSARKTNLSIPDETLQALKRYIWPGNVRELENVLERAMSLCDTTSIELSDLPDTIRAAKEFTDADHEADPSLNEYLSTAEKKHIESILIEVSWNKKLAVELLGISLASLYRKIDELGISSKK